MNEAANVPAFLAFLTAVLLVGGATITLIGSLGLGVIGILFTLVGIFAPTMTLWGAGHH